MTRTTRWETAEAPFSVRDVEFLKRWQHDPRFHPYTCTCGAVLVPRVTGLHCDDCGYRQTTFHRATMETSE